MSAIFGIFNRNKAAVDPAQIIAMQTSMAFRGADGTNIKHFGNCSFGHLMLKTTPQSEFELLPFRKPDSDLCITCDTRLDNRKSLLAQLFGSSSSAIPDSQIILRAYETWGRHFAEHLLGDFSIAIYDRKNQSLICARDHIGIKPWYYFCSPDQLIFATEIRAIFSALQTRTSQSKINPASSLAINPLRIADYLLDYEYYDFEATFFSQIFRLPPAYSMVVNPDRVTKNSYWQPKINPTSQSDADHQQEFQQLLTEAVNCRTTGSDTVACLLSGGIDSASVAYHISQQKRLHSFSALTTTPGCEDSNAIQTFLGSIDSVSCKIYPEDLSDVNDQLSRQIEKLDDPFTSAIAMLLALFNQASSKGHKIILDGVEGDFVTSLTYDYPNTLARMGQWQHLLPEIRGQHAMGLHNSIIYGLLQSVKSAYTPIWLRKLKHTLLAKTQIKHQFDSSLLAADLINDKALIERYLDLRLSRVNRYQNVADQHLWWITQPFIVSAIERYDRMAAVCGIEPRHPLLDKRLIEFCLNLPWHLKVNQGWRKWILRQSMQGHLPNAIIWRKTKPHLGWQFTQKWMQLNWPKMTSAVKDSSDLWQPYASKARVLPYFAAPAYNLQDSDSDPWDIYHLAIWLQKVQRGTL
ncbi:MAG: hypothetical protein KUG79_18670 [Pseudomonadales bacterium]|nr:hypothetical protein [Pseudomonadales bacterium]